MKRHRSYGSYRTYKVLITGAEGFIGSHLARTLVNLGAGVSALVHPDASRIRLADIAQSIRFYPADIRSAQEVLSVVKKVSPRFTFHLAAVTDVGRSWDRLSGALAVNLGGTFNLLSALSRVEHESVVTTCTAEVYGRNRPPFREEMRLDPVSPYSFSKAAASLLCRMSAVSLGMRVVILRLFLVYGPGQGEERFLPQLIKAGLSGKPFRMTGGRQTREYTYVEDVVEGMLRAAKCRKALGEVINLGSGREVALRELVRKVDDLLGGALVLHEKKLPYRPNEIFRFFGDHSKAVRILGWKASTGLAEGLGKTISWYRGRS